MADLYYSPEKFGLRVIGEAEFSSGSYEFDTVVLWRDTETGAFYTAQDSGCSCPMPFEAIGREQMTRIERLQDLLDYLDKAKADSYNYNTDLDYYAEDVTRIDAACAALVDKYREATP